MPVWKHVLLWILAIAAFLLLVFLPAGRLDWIWGWVWVGVSILSVGGMQFYMNRRNPTLLLRRLRVRPNTPTWDKLWLVVVKLLVYGVIVVSALDSGRFEWRILPLWTVPIGLLLHVISIVIVSRSMGENLFFEKTVCIQEDIGHKVVDTGPYASIRHPGYIGFALMMMACPLMLRSFWGITAVLVFFIWLIIRTMLEDWYLRANLPGYEAYTRRVRFRLIPWIW